MAVQAGNKLKRFLLTPAGCAIASVAGVSLIVALLKLTPLPTDPIHWPISLAYGLLPAAFAYLTAKRRQWLELAGVALIWSGWAANGFLHLKAGTLEYGGYNLSAGIVIYLTQAAMIFGLWQLDTKRQALRNMFIISLLMAGFGACIGFFNNNWLIFSRELTGWLFVWNIIYVLSYVPAGIASNGPNIEENHRRQREIQDEFQKAA